MRRYHLYDQSIFLKTVSLFHRNNSGLFLVKKAQSFKRYLSIVTSAVFCYYQMILMSEKKRNAFLENKI